MSDLKRETINELIEEHALAILANEKAHLRGEMTLGQMQASNRAQQQAIAELQAQLANIPPAAPSSGTPPAAGNNINIGGSVSGGVVNIGGTINLSSDKKP
jgi:hypothetical protein